MLYFLPYLSPCIALILLLLTNQTLKIGRFQISKILYFSFPWFFLPRFFLAAFPFGSSGSLRLGLTRSYPIINHIFIESPNTANPNSGNLPHSGIFADRNLVEFQVAGQFFGCHDVGHRQILRGKPRSYDYFRTVNDEYFSYISFKIIKINLKYMK